MKIQILMLSFLTLIYSSNVISVENECSKFVIGETLLNERTLLQTKSLIKSISQAKFYYQEEDICMPTTDSYIVGMLYGVMPRVLSVFDGHNANIEVYSVNNKHFLFLFFHAGGNQYSLRIYQLLDESILLVDMPTLSSNLKSIVFKDGVISVKNQIINESGKSIVLEETYNFTDQASKTIKGQSLL